MPRAIPTSFGALARESRSTLKLALPLVIGQVSQMLMGVVDTLMLGRLGVTELAVLTFVNSLFLLPFIFGIGVLTAVSVFTSQARGAEEPVAGRLSCRLGLQVSSVIGVVLAVLGFFLIPSLTWFGQPPEVAARAPVFYGLIMASLVPALMAMALKNHADAMDRPWPAFWIFLTGVGFNVFLNWILIYGHWGAPALGLEGAGLATLLSRLLIVVIMFAWLQTSRDLKEWVPRRWWLRPEKAEVRRFLALGIPSSLQMTTEMAAFTAAALLMGRFGEVSMAAHQIALMYGATAFMVPLGLSMALSVRVGETVGRQERQRLRALVLSGWVLAAGWAGVSATLFLFAGQPLAALFTQNPAVAGLVVQILVVVGVFQIVDSLQITASSMLRGLQDTRVPAILGVVSYWMVGIPLACLLSILLQWGAVGVWWGLAAGLAVACVTLCWRLWRKTAFQTT